VHSLHHTGSFIEKDVVVQISASTFDAHVLEVVGGLLLSATVVMLHPYGNMDFLYLTHILQEKQITYMLAVPTFLNHLYDFMDKFNVHPLSTLRSLCSGG
jgi:acyl-coenzyme A synthetase/AMP-(fatty) acid ligase